jgi:phage tail-like protein
MAQVVSGPRSRELAATAISPAGRGSVEGLPTPKPIADQLPAALQQDEFCVRLVSAFDEVLAPVFTALDCMDTYFDPDLAPPDFVDWLASWVGLDVDETWTVERRRQLIEEAAVLYRIRGTAAGVAAHVALYAGATPEIVDSGGCSWSQSAGSPMPGSAQPHLTVRLVVDDAAGIRRSTVSRIVDASRPAHVPFDLELLEGGAQVPTTEDGTAAEEAEGGADASAPGAVHLPGSEHIELAPQAPPTQEELDAPAEAQDDGAEPDV